MYKSMSSNRVSIVDGMYVFDLCRITNAIINDPQFYMEMMNTLTDSYPEGETRYIQQFDTIDEEWADVEFKKSWVKFDALSQFRIKIVKEIPQETIKHRFVIYSDLNTFRDRTLFVSDARYESVEKFNEKFKNGTTEFVEFIEHDAVSYTVPASTEIHCIYHKDIKYE